jgi:formate dehydrogenase maturation protein FdhE
MRAVKRFIEQIWFIVGRVVVYLHCLHCSTSSNYLRTNCSLTFDTMVLCYTPFLKK